MVKAKICLLAETVIRDSVKSTMSVINIIEGLEAESYPIFIPHIDFFVLWEKDTGDKTKYSVDAKIKIEDEVLN